MQVKDAWAATLRTLLQCASCEGVRKMAEIGTATRWHSCTTHAQRSQRQFPETTIHELMYVRLLRCTGVAVRGRAPNRKDARIVGVAFFLQDIECPFVAAHDGEVGCTIAQYATPGNVLQQFARPAHVTAKLAAAEQHYTPVSPAVRCDFVSQIGNMPNETWTPLCHPAEDEECAGTAVPCEQ